MLKIFALVGVAVVGAIATVGVLIATGQMEVTCTEGKVKITNK